MNAKKQTIDTKRVRRFMVMDLFAGIFFTTLFMLGVFVLINSTTFQLAGTIVSRVETNEKVVALTFDDGPLKGTTESILKVLGQQNVRATFYLIGHEIEKNPDQMRAIIEAGHELGNHSYGHQWMVFKGTEFVKNDVERNDAIFRSYGYNKIATFRPPYGDKFMQLPAYLSSTDRTTVMWDVASDEDGDAASITENVITNVRPGSIVMLHPMYDHRSESLRAIEPIIIALKSQGYRFVTVSELLEYRQ